MPSCIASPEMVKSEKSCYWAMKCQSVIGFGKTPLLKGIEEKKRALDTILEHYSVRAGEYAEKLVKGLAIIKVGIESMTGKKSRY